MTRYELPEYQITGWHNGNAEQTAEYVAKLRALRESKGGYILYNAPVTAKGQKCMAERATTKDSE